MPISASSVALLLYAASLILYFRHLYDTRTWIGRGATLCLVLGLVFHYLGQMERAREIEAVPYQDLYGSMSLLAWLLALTYLGLELRHRQRAVGALVMPVVLLLTMGEVFVSQVRPQVPAPAERTLFALHVTSNILAYAAFAIAFVLGLIFLLQNRMLRDRRPGATFWRFPALEVLERMSRSSVAVGVLAMMVGMTLGFILAERLHGSYWSGDAKEIVSLVILAAYGAYLWLSGTTTWRGARAAKLCVINFAFVLFSYTIVNLFLTEYHRYF
jgi:ABC-type transport system involved in cytochrome c biogenesis permease subunit